MDVAPSNVFATSKTTTTATATATATCTNCSKVNNSFVKGMAGLMALELFEVMLLFGNDATTSAVIALAFFDAVSLELVATVDADKPLDLAPFMAKASVAALNKAEYTLPDGKTKADAIKTIITAYFQGMGKNNGYGLTAADQQALLNSFVAAGTSGIADAGVDDKNTAVAAVSSGMILSMDNAGIATTEFPLLSHDLMTSLVGNLKNAGLTDSAAIGSACAAATRAAIAGLTGAGVSDKTQQSTIIDQMTAGGVAGLSDLGLTAEQQTEISGKIAEGATQGMSDVGFTSAEIDAHKTTLNNQITTGLQTNGATADQAAKAGDDIKSKIDSIISGLGK